MQPLLKLSNYYCPVERKACVGWIEEVFKDCLCNLNDEISFGFGIASLVCWAVAEIPQIVTNFNNKSAAGVSLAFLSTWIIGDVFNLVGCILEPATLPTQFYTALLYTVVTIILALQCIYYNRFVPWWKRNKDKDESELPLEGKLQDERTAASTNAQVEVPRRKDFYFTSARSLAGSNTPPNDQYCYMKAKSGPPALQHLTDSSSEEEDSTTAESLLNKKTVTQPRNIPRSVIRYGAFLAASANLPHLSRASLRKGHGIEIEFSGIRLWQKQELYDENPYGQWLGWLMAAIYMGGRIPQIWLNIKRGTVEGLNPFMFVFALAANATYVASILVRSREWRKMKANMPWLLDAIVCVFLDLFIILQYIFYKYINKKLKAVHQYYGPGDYAVQPDI